MPALSRRGLLQAISGAIALNTSADTVAQSASTTDQDVYWPQFGRDQANTASAPTIDGPRRLTERWTFTTMFEVSSQPVIADGTVYVGSEDRRIYALSLESGEKLWSRELAEAVEASPPAVVGNRLFVATDDGYLYALERSDGSILWQEEMGWPRGVTATGEVVVYRSFHRIVARDAESGEEQWEISPDGGVIQTPAVDDERVFFGTTANEVHAVSLSTGETVWTFRPFDEVWSDPAVYDGTVYIGSDDQRLWAIDAAEGTEEWNVNSGARIRSSPAIDEEAVYVANRGNELTKLDRQCGTVQWTRELRGVTSPAVANGVVYGCGSRDIVALNAEDGSELDRFAREDFKSWTPPAITSDHLVAGNTEWEVLALGPPVSAVAYTDEEGIVDTDGLREAVEDWRAGEIDTAVLGRLSNTGEVGNSRGRKDSTRDPARPPSRPPRNVHVVSTPHASTPRSS